jgi:hypothetical protein
VKAEVKSSIAFLLKERERDGFRSALPRLAYEQVTNRQAPTFSLDRA